MDGGGLAVDQKGRVTTIWRREDSVFTADGNGSERSLGPGRNPTAVAARSGFYAAWTEGKAVRLRKPTVKQAEIVAQDGAFPSMAALSNGLVTVAWESKGAIVIQTVE